MQANSGDSSNIDEEGLNLSQNLNLKATMKELIIEKQCSCEECGLSLRDS